MHLVHVEIVKMYTYRQNCSIHRVHLSVASNQVIHQPHVSDCQFCPFDWNDRQRSATPTDAQSLYLQPHFLTAFCSKISLFVDSVCSKIQPTKSRKQFTVLIRVVALVKSLWIRFILNQMCCWIFIKIPIFRWTYLFVFIREDENWISFNQKMLTKWVACEWQDTIWRNCLYTYLDRCCRCSCSTMICII